MYPYQIYQYLTTLSNYLKAQQQKINELENAMESLKNEMNELKEKNWTNIEKIEYKFDQLKVETLEGTLNIGLNPNAPENIEDFSVNQDTKVPHVLNRYPDMFPRVQDHIHQYLEKECPILLNNLQQKYKKPLHETHIDFILQDVHKQIDERIHYYLKEVNEDEMNQLNPEDIKERTCRSVQEDINKAIEIYIQNMPEGGHF